MKRIGFIGLGIMGKPMARNLLNARFDVTVYNCTRAKAEELAAEGAAVAETLSDVAKCPIIITMLPNGPQVKEVVLSPEFLNSVAPGTLLIDMSSISPVVTKEIGEALAKKGVRMLDAPVSGGEPKAVSGELAIMVGGDEPDFEEAKPLFDVLGSSALLVGPLGSGNTCKLTNQIIVAVNIAALSEGMMLAKKMGTDPEKVFEAIRGGLAGSSVMNAKMPMILEQNFKPGFKIDLHIKDLNNAIEAAEANDSPSPLSRMVREMMLSLRADDLGQCDHSGLALYYQKLTGMKIES
jgi:2-hydroxy-3-oxopropionate reductase